MNFLKMTIINNQVFKMKANWENYGLSHARNNVSFFVPSYAKPLFSGSEADCFSFIKQSGADLVI